MMNVNIYDTELFPYLEGEALVGLTLKLTIRSLQMEEMSTHGGKKETKPVLYFNENKKGFVMNKTNAKIIAILYGPETGGWEGKQITLYTEQVRAFGETHNALRVMPAKQGVDQVKENWLDLSPSKGQFFKRVLDDLNLAVDVAAQMLKAEGFTNGYDPTLAPDMWKALLNAPMPQAQAERSGMDELALINPPMPQSEADQSAMDEVEAEEEAQAMIDDGLVEPNGPRIEFKYLND